MRLAKKKGETNNQRNDCLPACPILTDEQRRLDDLIAATAVDGVARVLAQQISLDPFLFTY